MQDFHRRRQFFVLFFLAMVGLSQALNPMKYFIMGGWVMYPILALSIVSVGVTLERVVVVFLEKLKVKPGRFLDDFLQKVGEDGSGKMEAVAWAEGVCQKRGGVLAELLLTVCHKYRDGTSKKMHPAELKEWMKKSAEERAGVELTSLDNHLSALAVISNCSTLMGLFGTVIGMISAFTAMANSPGGVKADEMAGGIAIALVATAGGLCVAVPSLILYNILKGAVIENYVTQVEETVIKVVDALAE
jgi:biopolymer transport protein ExbB